jgi:predicted nucleic acid-binding protein
VKVIVDTNVVAYVVLGAGPSVDEARDLLAAVDEPWAPAIWQAELTNALWMATRHNVITVSEAAKRLTLADGLGIHSVADRTLWQGALVRSHRSGVAVYDTLFVELAAREGVPLATFDSVVLKAFPTVATRPRDIARE